MSLAKAYLAVRLHECSYRLIISYYIWRMIARSKRLADSNLDSIALLSKKERSQQATGTCSNNRNPPSGGSSAVNNSKIHTVRVGSLVFINLNPVLSKLCSEHSKRMHTHPTPMRFCKNAGQCHHTSLSSRYQRKELEAPFNGKIACVGRNAVACVLKRGVRQSR